MSAKQVLWAVLGVQVVIALTVSVGEATGTSAAILASLAAQVAGSFMLFLWYCRDSDDYQYRRSLPLSMGVVSLPMVAIPYYLLRTRARGRRGKALLRAVGFLMLMGAATVLGMFLHELTL